MGEKMPAQEPVVRELVGDQKRGGLGRAQQGAFFTKESPCRKKCCLKEELPGQKKKRNKFSLLRFTCWGNYSNEGGDRNELKKSQSLVGSAHKQKRGKEDISNQRRWGWEEENREEME